MNSLQRERVYGQTGYEKSNEGWSEKNNLQSNKDTKIELLPKWGLQNNSLFYSRKSRESDRVGGEK